jgi:hypothetical protein
VHAEKRDAAIQAKNASYKKNEMKKFIILCLLSTIFFFSCEKNEDSDQLMDIRYIAWQYLSDQSKSTVTINWMNAPVTETEYIGLNAYAVSFKTSEDAVLGPFIIYIDKYSKIVIGTTKRM